MVRKLLLGAILVFIAFGSALAQSGTIKGKILDRETNQPIPFANVIALKGGIQAGGAQSDIDGNFEIKPLDPGTYDLKASYVGYNPIQITGIIVSAGKIVPQNLKLSSGIDLDIIEFIEYDIPLLDPDPSSSGGTVGRDEIAKMPGRTPESVAVTVGGVFSQDGERGSVRGSRGDATDTYIDGIKVIGSTNLPNSAMEQVSMIQGGVPAQFGDATGGIISITTRGPESRYSGGVEMVTSQFLDAYDYNLLGWSLTGPLLTKLDTRDSIRKPILGFFLSGEARYEGDPRPSAVGSYKVNDTILQSLQNDPLRPSGTGTGTFANTNFVYDEDLEHFSKRLNVERKGLVLQSKVDWATSSTTNLTFGAFFNYSHNKDAGTTTYNNTLFNYYNNPDIFNTDMMGYLKFTQRLQSDSNSVIKNAYYFVQVDYSREHQKVWDATHRDNFFNYGYIGKFTSRFVNTYDYRNGQYGPGYYHNAFNQVAFDFEPGSVNPYLSNYTSRFYDLYDNSLITRPLDVETSGGLLNGQLPGSVYSLWTSPGVPYNSYSKYIGNQGRIRANFSASVKDHEFLVGLEYEQRVERSYNLSPAGLWRRAYDLTNFHIQQLDTTKALDVTHYGTYQTITYDRNYVESDQAFFDYNLRNSLGLATDGTDWVDVWSYDPSQMDLNFFSADELLVNGFRSSYVSYYGFDHAGNKQSGNPNLDDFFTAKDEFGNFKREVAPFQPVYISGYIQDKFSFRDLIFNVGVRVDRFDANQPVLKDQYSFFETVKAGELTAENSSWISDGNEIPANIGSDYVVYVSDINNPQGGDVVGFRNGDQWYDATGNLLSNPTSLYTSNGIAPYLVEPDKRDPSVDLNSSAFEDYTPQVVVMPRVAFAFPISDEANLFAHYDILSQRPSTGLRLDPIDYLFISSAGNNVINNPNLRPEKTIDYELGFEQKISNSSAIKLSAFYREFRDMIAVNYVQGAFPRDYITYVNQDFATVKGLIVSYDLRRTGNTSLYATYTLQFADGSGSTATTGLNLIQSGQQSLRTVFPLNFDQRHAITARFDYRYGAKGDYNGPTVKGKQILANTGLNAIFRVGSGVPYTANTNVTLKADDTGDRGLLQGGINGARLPWTIGLDLRLDRDFKLEWGSEDNKKKKVNLNAYLLFLNVLNNQNVIRVYNATGSATDDGYLAAAEFQNSIETQNDPQSYRDLYTVKLNRPTNFSMPRRIRLGIIMNF